MISFLETLRETFTLYLAAGMMFSVASIWAAVQAVRSESDRKKHGAQRSRFDLFCAETEFATTAGVHKVL